MRDIKHVIEEELNGKVEKMFAHFEDQPIGAASLAQVHKATLHDGRVVAVKVQNRDVQKHAAVDIKTLEVNAGCVLQFSNAVKPPWMTTSCKQSNFRNPNFVTFCLCIDLIKPFN